MDSFVNPFTPGAGSPPPELAGRDEVMQAARLALRRIRAGRAERSQMLLGLRGVGKTVLLNRIARIARELDYQTVWIEAPEGRALAETLAPALKAVLLRLSRIDRARSQAAKAAAALRGFASAFKVTIGELEFAVAEPPSADSGNLEIDLPELFLATARAAQAADGSVALFIDEVQYLAEPDLRGLIVALHRVAQEGLPLVFFGAGLPQVAALAGDAKSYAERLFAYPDVGPLPEPDAMTAIRQPIHEEGVAIEPEALRAIVEVTRGYPFFLQQWGKHAWNMAPCSPITAADVARASRSATDEMDKGFFRVRFDRLTNREQDYLRAMAELGPGPHSSGAIANELGTLSESVGPLRAGLIRKGMIYSPKHGETAFTVPMFDEYMRREVPVWVSRKTPAGRAGRRSGKPQGSDE